LYINVILPLNIKGTYTYKIPECLRENIQIGMRVVVPFGGRKLYTGIISKIHESYEKTDAFLPKEIISILDREAILPKNQLLFWNWLSEYYLCNIGEIYRFAFPSSMKLESETYVRKNPDKEPNYDLLDANEINLICALDVKSSINLKELEAFITKKEIIKTLNGLIDHNLIIIDEKIYEKYKSREISYIKIKDKLLKNTDIYKILSNLSRATKQKEMFLAILNETSSGKDFIKKSKFIEKYSFNNQQLKSLINKGLVEEFYLQKNRIEYYDGDLESIDSLTSFQEKALKDIESIFEHKDIALLHGVTGSGKTHLYINLAEKTIKNEKNILIIFPEVGLTKQILHRLEKKYGKHIGYYHPKLSDFEKVEVWKKIKNNEFKVILGTRHSLFLPFQNLGLIIVDEEHDSQYKSTSTSPFFNAKDSAIMLGRFYNAKVLLGSATPSLETYHSAIKGKIGIVELKQRFGDSKIPNIHLIDFKEAQNLKKTHGYFSEQIIREIQIELEKKKQVIVLHNRRGYSNVIECKSCGYVQYCSNCDVVMTYHKVTNELKCHYCGQRTSILIYCPSCHSQNLTTKGLGIQQLEEELQKLFPNANIGRIDTDSMRSKFAYEKFFEKIENKNIDIILGTQIISKGLDFNFVDLVVVPKADSLLHIQDFRAEERAFQLLTQISGRAGRNSKGGRMLLQTYNPDQQIFDILSKSTNNIYEYFLKERKKFLYPPFVKLVHIELKHLKEEKAERASKFLGSTIRKYLPEECILGPEKSQISRINNLYQYQILIKLPKSKKYHILKQFISKSIDEFREISGYKSVKLNLCIDF